MSVASCGCDATFAELAACHCGKCHRSFADPPAYDARRRLARPCLHPTLLGMELLGDLRLGLGSSRRRITQDPAVRLTKFAIENTQDDGRTPPRACLLKISW